MRIIADTHIYYHLGQQPELFELVATKPISPNLYNVLELCSSPYFLKDPDLVREAHRRLIHFNDNLILEPPFIHISKLFCDIEYNLPEQFEACFKFSSAVANGEVVKPEYYEHFKNWSKDVRSNGELSANFANQKLMDIRPNVKKKEHWKKDTYKLTMELLNSLVVTATERKCDLYEKDLSLCELLIKTIDHFFKELEVSQKKITGNDLTDLLMLAYVQPGDLFWTKEKIWIRIIEESGCGDYLFRV